jgi:hypothetical protein
MLISADGLSQPRQRTSTEIEVPCIERVADRRRRLRGTLEPEHAFIPSLAREPIGLLAGSPRLLRCGADRSAVDRFPRLRAHFTKMGCAQDSLQAATCWGLAAKTAEWRSGPTYIKTRSGMARRGSVRASKRQKAIGRLPRPRCRYPARYPRGAFPSSWLKILAINH